MLRLVEIFAARVAPGIINIVSLLAVADFLLVGQYGQFSLVLASCSAVAALSTGPIFHAIVPLYAVFSMKGAGNRYDSQIFGALFVAVGSFSTFGMGLVSFGLIELPWLLLYSSLALFTASQPILRARLQFWRYGMAGLTQALITLTLVLWAVSASPSVPTGIWAYVFGYFAGFVVGWLLCGAPVPRWPDRAMLRSSAGVGISFTVSSFSETALILGVRYSIMLFGNPQLLGLFSLCVDLAQRTVGVVINVASFAVVPRAYKSAAQGNSSVFRASLLRGAAVSGGLAAVLFGALAVLDRTGVVLMNSRGVFSGVAFAAVSFAVVIDRLKKMVLDPLLVHSGRASSIPICYMIVAPLSIISVAASLRLGHEMPILAIYPATYLGAATLSLVAYLRAPRKT